MHAAHVSACSNMCRAPSSWPARALAHLGSSRASARPPSASISLLCKRRSAGQKRAGVKVWAAKEEGVEEEASDLEDIKGEDVEEVASEEEAGGEEEEASDLFSAGVTWTGSTPAGDEVLGDVKARLLASCAATSRGQAASASEMEGVKGLISQLEGMAAGPVDVAELDGTWVMCFASVQTIRSSPFFRAFKEVLGDEFAEDMYAFTDALPGVTKGRAVQVFDMAAGKLVSEVDLKVQPLPYVEATGTMVTTSSFDVVDPSTLKLQVETTQVVRNTMPFFDQVIFPTRQALDLARADGVPVSLATTYLDGDMRVSRYDDGSVFVYTRV
eukprot:CAMPEP_0182907860 /NCGR_PEP_ID=MMETSP0034_2-20130328/34804_1 /TAXON_ID=156128 /ORGANISM="Nephroselmis pyriformis, Strain CCMP717" /LENGTH=327 /DNA_ID=CAMNT_0025043913 /DNA_START=1 /DNA_END=984 /DNA_ORIENTATION=+